MSALVLQNNALWYIFEDFTASILLSACFLIYVIRNQFSNHPTHDNKIANELSARMTEINGILTAEIEKNKTRDGSITAEIERLLTDVYKKLSAEVNTKIANELPARLSEINSTFTAELGRINNELNGKLTAEIKKINSRDADYASEAQRILSIVNNIEEACRNDFASVNASIEALQNGLIQCYTNNRRIQPVETDQVSNHSEASNRSHASGSSSGSEPMSFKGISLTIWTQFKQIFDKIKAEKRFNLEEMCLHVAMEIRELGGNIKKVTVQGFYERNIKKKDGYISTLDDIGLWIDSKLNVNNNANSANNIAE